MLSSIELDHDSSLKTCEIENVVAERMLPPKFCSVDLPAPQRLPQLVFGVGRVASQCALALIVADFLPGLAFHGSLLFFLVRSEEHTSELQSLMRISYAVFCLKK